MPSDCLPSMAGRLEESPEEGAKPMRRFMNLYLDEDKGAGAGGVADPKPDEATEVDAVRKELEALKAENEKLKKEEADRQAKAEEERKAKLTEEQRKAEEEKALRDSLVSQNRDFQLKKAGLDKKYAALVTGDTAEEIEASGALVAQLVEETKAAAVAEAKKGMAATGAPGVGGHDDAMTLEEYTLKTLKGGR